AQAIYVADQVLEPREAGIYLRHQAVLFRTSHHSGRLEIELAGRNIPFLKYGGLKFIEAAHVKDLLAILRWAENPRDALAGFRVLQLLPGIGPASAKKAMAHVGEHGFDLGELAGFAPPDAEALSWPGFCLMLRRLRDAATAFACSPLDSSILGRVERSRGDIINSLRATEDLVRQIDAWRVGDLYGAS